MSLKKFIKSPLAIGVAAALTIGGLDAYTLLKTFKLSHIESYVEDGTSTNTTLAYASSLSSSSNQASLNQISSDQEETSPKEVSSNTSQSSRSNLTSQLSTTRQGTVTDSSYQDENIQINIDTLYQNNTTIYVADIQLSSSDYLKTALAQNAYGLNVTQTTSNIAAANNAILAINGDYYGANQSGYVIKNGTLYRNTVRSSKTTKDLAIYQDGSFEIIDETMVSAETLLENGVVNLLAFGPALIENGEIVVSTTDEVSKAMSQNPRTAIGIIDENHYIIVVSDGRTAQSEGLSLYQLAQVMESYGAVTAYNLDGGGSSTLYFNGQVINQPTTNGSTIKEREVSDIVYIGY